MPFIAKNPLSLPEIDNTPSTPPGTRGIFAKKDGFYEVDASGNEAKLGGDPSVQSDLEQNDETQIDYVKNRIAYTIYSQIHTTRTFTFTPDCTYEEYDDLWLIPGSQYDYTINYKEKGNPAHTDSGQILAQSTVYSPDPWLEIDEGVVQFSVTQHRDGAIAQMFWIDDYNQWDECTITIEGDFNEVDTVIPLAGRYISNGSINDEKLSYELKEKLMTKESDIANIVYTSTGFIATFKTLLKKGMQLFYNYTSNGQNISGMAKPIKINGDGKLEVSIGDKYHTDFALRGISVDLYNMEFTFIESVDYTVNVNELSIPTPIPFKFLGLSEGLNLGFNSEVTPESLNSNNFGSSNYIDGEHSNTFGTGNTVRGKVSTAIGQNANITGNLNFLGGDRGDISGRCDFGYGTDISMSGQNSGAVGYGLISIGDNQFIMGQFNASDPDAYLIIGGGGSDSSRQNVLVVKKDGSVYINGAKLIAITQADKDKIGSFNSNGSNNTNTGASSAQFGFGNSNSNENVIQLGRDNDTTSSTGGYIYQLGYGNKSLYGQNYLFGKKLIGADYDQYIIGRFNAKTSALFAIGNGSNENNRVNAMEINRNTNRVDFYGDVYSKGFKTATENFVTESLDAILGTGAPEALDTIAELAKAMGDDPNFKESLATKDYVDEEIAENRVCYDTKVILGEAHLTSEQTQMGYFDGICDVRIPKELVEVGKEYKYTINGKSGTFVFDDSYMDFGGTSGYVYDYGDEYDWQTCWPWDSTIDIVLYDGELKVLDEKFIPDTIARKTDIENIESKFDYTKYPLPVLYLDGDVSAMTKDDAVDLTYRYKDMEGTANVKWQGSSSLAYPKKNYTVDFGTAFEAKTGWGAHKKYVMKANWIDFSHSRNIAAAKIWGECIDRYETYVWEGHPLRDLPNGGAVDGFPIVIVINGEYQGLYTFSIPKDGWMLGLSDTNTAHCIIGASGVDNEMCGFFKEPVIDDDQGFEYEFLANNVAEEKKKWFQTSLQNLYTALQNCDSRDKLINNVGAYLRLEKAVVYMVYCAHLGNYDGLTKNYLLWQIDGRWHMSAYDLDATFGNNPYGDTYYFPGQFDYARLASTNMIFRKIYDYGQDLLQKWHERLYALKPSEINMVLYQYAVGIPKVYFDEEVKVWEGIPGTKTNTIEQAMTFSEQQRQFLEDEIGNKKATEAYVDNKIGDINNALESILAGGVD